jgi:HlyD family secretion protein
MFRGKRKWILVIIVVVIVGGLVATNLTKDRTKKTEVVTDFAELGELVETVAASGKIHPVTEVNISAKVTAEIIEMPVEEGQYVHKGDLLVKLDPTDYREAVELAEQRLRSAQANLAKAQSTYNQVQSLYEKNLESAYNLDNAQADLDIAQSGVEQAKASLKDAQDRLAKTVIYSPMEGTITVLNKEVGEIVSEAMFREDVIMVVADLSQMEVQVEVDENDIVDVEIGDPVSIEIDAFPDTTFRGKVAEISHSATTRGYGTQEEVTNFLVKVAVLDDIERLRPGMSSTVDVEVHRLAQAISIPIQCVVMRRPEWENPDSLKAGDTTGIQDEGKKPRKERRERSQRRRSEGPEGEGEEWDKDDWVEVVFVVEDDIAKRREVKTGISSETNIQIIEGIKEGEEVVSGSYRVLGKELHDGDHITRKKEDRFGEWDEEREE